MEAVSIFTSRKKKAGICKWYFDTVTLKATLILKIFCPQSKESVKKYVPYYTVWDRFNKQILFSPFLLYLFSAINEGVRLDRK